MLRRKNPPSSEEVQISMVAPGGRKRLAHKMRVSRRAHHSAKSPFTVGAGWERFRLTRIGVKRGWTSRAVRRISIRWFISITGGEQDVGAWRRRSKESMDLLVQIISLGIDSHSAFSLGISGGVERVRGSEARIRVKELFIS
jgi:hypothetical protein